MSALRIVGLNVLILAAGTLPASARCVPLPVEADEADPPPTNQSPSENGKEPGDKAEHRLQIAPEADAWDGPSSRNLTTRPFLSTISPAIKDHCCSIQVESEWSVDVTTGESANTQSQRCWLLCRFAHAPPVCI